MCHRNKWFACVLIIETFNTFTVDHPLGSADAEHLAISSVLIRGIERHSVRRMETPATKELHSWWSCP